MTAFYGTMNSICTYIKRNDLIVVNSINSRLMYIKFNFQCGNSEFYSFL